MLIDSSERHVSVRLRECGGELDDLIESGFAGELFWAHGLVECL